MAELLQFKNPNEDILTQAGRLISQDRNETYGPFYDEAAKTAFITDMILSGSKHQWTPPQRFGLQLVVHKLVRAGHSYKQDNFVDAAGYLELLDRMFREAKDVPPAPGS